MRNIFRDKVLARLSMPENLDERIKFIIPSIWLALFPVLIILVIAGIWGWFGRIDTKVSGAGVLMTVGGLRSITAQSGGTLKYLNVEEGNRVRQNQVLGVVDQPLLELEIKQLADKLILLKKQLGELENDNKKSKELREDYFEKINGVADATIGKMIFIEDHIKELSDMYEKLRSKGLTTKEIFYKELENFATAEVNVAREKGEKYKLPIDRFDFYHELRRTIWEKQREIQLTQNELDAKRITYTTDAVLTSPISGVVAEVMKSPGDSVSAGNAVLSIFPQAADAMQMVAFLSARNWKKLMINQLVYVSPTDVEPQRHGYMVGIVRYIAKYPNSEQTLDNFFKNSDLASFLKNGEPLVIKILIELVPDSSNSTNVKWTCSPPTGMTLTLGTPCQVAVVVERRPPITYVVPWLKEKLLGVGETPVSDSSHQTQYSTSIK